MIPVQYSATYKFYDDPERFVGFTRTGAANRTIYAEEITPHKGMPGRGDDPKVAPQPFKDAGYIIWNATDVRAYPSPVESIGGKIIVTVFANPEAQHDGLSQDNLKNYPSYMHNPDAVYGFGMIKPTLPTTWVYPTTLGIEGVEENYDNVSNKLPSTNFYNQYYTSTGSFKLNNAPKITVASNALFDLRYLPTMSVKAYLPSVIESVFDITLFSFVNREFPGYNWDYIYPLSWLDADVYWATDKYDSSQWNFTTKYFGTKVSGGFAGINTGHTTSGTSRSGGRYTLVLNIPFTSSYGFTHTLQYITALDITDMD